MNRGDAEFDKIRAAVDRCADRVRREREEKAASIRRLAELWAERKIPRSLNRAEVIAALTKVAPARPPRRPAPRLANEMFDQWLAAEGSRPSENATSEMLSQAGDARHQVPASVPDLAEYATLTHAVRLDPVDGSCPGDLTQNLMQLRASYSGDDWGGSLIGFFFFHPDKAQALPPWEVSDLWFSYTPPADGVITVYPSVTILGRAYAHAEDHWWATVRATLRLIIHCDVFQADHGRTSQPIIDIDASEVSETFEFDTQLFALPPVNIGVRAHDPVTIQISASLFAFATSEYASVGCDLCGGYVTFPNGIRTPFVGVDFMPLSDIVIS